MFFPPIKYSFNRDFIVKNEVARLFLGSTDAELIEFACELRKVLGVGKKSDRMRGSLPQNADGRPACLLGQPAEFVEAHWLKPRATETETQSDLIANTIENQWSG